MRFSTLLLALVCTLPRGGRAQTADVPEAAANDHRTPAGAMVQGELQVELEAVEAVWRPRGPNGPAIVTPAFAEIGRAPQVPGPLLRLREGVPVRVSVRNRLERPIHVRGLSDRASGGAASLSGDGPAFFFEEPLEIPPGEVRAATFVPKAEVSSFYYGRVVTDPSGDLGSTTRPGGNAGEGAFLGGLVVDPPEGPLHPDERVFLITRWGSPTEPGSLDVSWKMFMNGRSWPFTERLEMTVGDTVRWRIVNASAADHPMHLHGFYFRVEAVGDAQRDSVLSPDSRRQVVTEYMRDFSALRVSWVPERPGNWLFHCHLIRHMGEAQRFEADRASGSGHPDHPAQHGGASAAVEDHDMDMMAGLITGITIHPREGIVPADPAPVRRLDLWTGSRPGVFDEGPGLGFVVQEGGEAIPALDSIQAMGEALVLREGEPTEIVVHNRLDFPLSVHWHGLEIRSLYDGVGGWSGMPGSVRPPIPPGGSERVVINPVRAGTFFYHTHGEPGHELSQGLYGPFLVLAPGTVPDPDGDRVFVLASRGADMDAAPAVNGSTDPAPERFDPGRTYRLRFAHISPDEAKVVRLTRDGEPVPWEPIAKDGAGLPPQQRTVVPAEFRIGVGEAFDFLWGPADRGVYVLEVETFFYPSVGGRLTQRIPFIVGDATAEEVAAALPAPDGLIPAELPLEAVGRIVGTWLAEMEGTPMAIRITEEHGSFSVAIGPRGETPLGGFAAFAVAEDRLVPGRRVGDRIIPLAPGFFLQFDFTEGSEPSVTIPLEPGVEVIAVRAGDAGMH